MFHHAFSALRRVASLAAVLALLAGSVLTEQNIFGAGPALPPLGQSLENLIKQAGNSYKQPDKNEPIFDVFVEKGNDTFKVRCIEHASKYGDGSEFRWISMWMQMTDGYGKDVEVPPELTRAIAEANEGVFLAKYSLLIDSSKSWAATCQGQLLLQGLTDTVFDTYLYAVVNAAAAKKEAFSGFISDQVGTK